MDGLPVPQRKAVVRTDTNDVLGVVGQSYQPVQNHQCFSFLDAVAAGGQVEYHTAGLSVVVRKSGCWQNCPVRSESKNQTMFTERFLLLSNSHDGSSALRVFFTPIRVVCANTLGLAERRGRGQGLSIVHKGDLFSKVNEAQKVLGIANTFFDRLQDKFAVLADYYPSREQLDDYFSHLYPDVPGVKNRRAANVRSELMYLFENGRGQNIPETRLSMWSAFNAVTEYVDHHRSTRGDSDRDRADRRLESAWFGSGASLKARAWDYALALAT